MSSYFTKIRRLTAWASTAAPVLFFITFLCYAYGLGYWVILPFLVAAALSFGFPLERLPASSQESGADTTRWLGWIRWAGLMFFMLWITHLPEFIPLIDRIYTKESLQDWSIILAMLIWHSCWSVSNYLKAQQLEDKEIIAIYEESDQKT